jgi:hypothetical protein
MVRADMAKGTVVFPTNLDSQGLRIQHSTESQEGLVRGAIFDTAIGDSDVPGLER